MRCVMESVVQERPGGVGGGHPGVEVPPLLVCSSRCVGLTDRPLCLTWSGSKRCYPPCPPLPPRALYYSPHLGNSSPQSLEGSGPKLLWCVLK